MLKFYSEPILSLFSTYLESILSVFPTCSCQFYTNSLFSGSASEQLRLSYPSPEEGKIAFDRIVGEYFSEFFRQRDD